MRKSSGKVDEEKSMNFFFIVFFCVFGPDLDVQKKEKLRKS